MSIVTVIQESQIGVATEAAEHDLAAVSGEGEDTPYDDQENVVPALSEILGDGMARPEAAGGDIADMAQGAQGAAAQKVNALESVIVFSDARVILTDGTASQNEEATSMGCGGQAQVIGQHPAETAGSCTDIAPNAMGSEINTAGGDGNALEQPASGLRSNGAGAVDYNNADAEANFDARTCDICKLPNSPESLLLCDECNKGYHTYCLQPALPSVPPGQ
jgi:hypothetical protein